ncbi:MAG: tyrosine-type recombinase/integrase [Alphaproteobacteria bacterium]
MEADLLLPPHVHKLPRAAEWLKLQVALGRAANTIAAYGRGLDDYLSFCSRTGIDPQRAGRAEIATYLRDLAERPPTHSRSATGLANATLRQRVTIIRLFYEHLVEEGVRPVNPVGRGAAGGRGGRAMVQAQRQLPWIPSEDDWRAIIDAARDEPLRNRLMLALAYDAALRREELCSLETGDFDPAYRTLTLRAETTKTKRARCIPYSAAAAELFAAYLRERRVLATSRGLLFLSTSTRNRATPISKWSWSKIVRGLGLRAGVAKLTTHSFRHLCLTDLARAGWEAHEIASFAGHRSLQSTLLYIHLSARDLAGKFARGMAAVHDQRVASLLGHP